MSGGEGLRYRRVFSALLTLVYFMLLAAAVKAYFDGSFDSVESLREYIRSFGSFAPAVLPLFPDGLFCYFSGLTKMSLKKLS